MEKLLHKTRLWVQIIFAIYFVAFASFNWLRVIAAGNGFSIVLIFTILLGATIALLWLSIREYRQDKKADEAEEIDR